ncbi:MAG: hypothetical protein ACOYI3_08885, partial [Christensenellales bacterium]
FLEILGQFEGNRFAGKAGNGLDVQCHKAHLAIRPFVIILSGIGFVNENSRPIPMPFKPKSTAWAAEAGEGNGTPVRWRHFTAGA